MVNLDKQLMNVIQASSCFGLAYDSSISECKQCDLSAQCKAKSKDKASGRSLVVGEIDLEEMPTKTTKAKSKAKKDTPKKQSKPKPSTEGKTKGKDVKKPSKPKSKAPQKDTQDITIPGEMPEFKGMPYEDVVKIAEDNKVEWKDYGNENINRMRLVMTLKKMYN